ncbi:J domain-containing protein [Tistrella mobilis]|jgi:hypothetical protein|uniref:Heat shock protein DnaJ n=1 Tax=Tistrella mobilis (strain KA081020-065) TaxID=1110502 RepID=I3THD8_TISMK|nr:J domain-containing protein [Tistrella mobilis]AFK52176.1 heat shock protein DnaJ [Tistrella mobilis KA081020-065]MAM73987.1 molecular chaperone DnaJ [Tistrella sp.]
MAIDLFSIRRTAAYAPDGTRLCDCEGCGEEGAFRAPKSRDRLRDYYFFCLEHVRAYNKGWDYFKGLSSAEIDRHLHDDMTWHRPSWPFASADRDQADEVARAAAQMFREGRTSDPFGMFGAAGRAAERVRAAAEARFTPDERQAFKTLGIDPTRDLPQIKDHYKKLAKRLHPDVTGGDAASEERMKSVNQAYSFLMHRASDWT